MARKDTKFSGSDLLAAMDQSSQVPRAVLLSAHSNISLWGFYCTTFYLPCFLFCLMLQTPFFCEGFSLMNLSLNFHLYMFVGQSKSKKDLYCCGSDNLLNSLSLSLSHGLS